MHTRSLVTLLASSYFQLRWRHMPQIETMHPAPADPSSDLTDAELYQCLHLACTVGEGGALDLLAQLERELSGFCYSEWLHTDTKQILGALCKACIMFPLARVRVLHFISFTRTHTHTHTHTLIHSHTLTLTHSLNSLTHTHSHTLSYSLSSYT